MLLQVVYTVYRRCQQIRKDYKLSVVKRPVEIVMSRLEKKNSLYHVQVP